MVKKILIVHTRELCYFSGEFFLDRMQESLENYGVEVTRLDLSLENSDYSQLEQFVGKSFDGVVDINSKLPYFTLEKNIGDFTLRYLLDEIDAPFFNYILDHPLYHHPGLVFPLKNYHAIGIDATHCQYMKENYHHLKSVSFLPVAGTKALNVRPWEQRQMDVLFTGTYEEEEKQIARLRELGEDIYRLGRDLVDELMTISMGQDFSDDQMPITMEALVKDHIQKEAYAARILEQMDFATLMNHLYPVDKYVRNRKRRELLEKLAQRQISFTVMGEGWEQTRLADESGVTLLKPQTIARSFETIANSRVLLDINPLFPQGVHDRVTTAIANHTTCVSNMSRQSDTSLRDGKEMYYYQENDVNQLKDILIGIKQSAPEEMIENAYQYYEQEYSWNAHARKLREIIAN